MFAWISNWVDGFKVKTWEAYCFKCRCKRAIDRPRTAILKNGRETRQGNCVYCGTHMSIISGHRLGKA